MSEPLLHPDGSYDRTAIMNIAHKSYRAPGNSRTFQDCLRWVWATAKRERELLVGGHHTELARLRDMRAHHIERMRARPRIETRAA